MATNTSSWFKPWEYKSYVLRPCAQPGRDPGRCPINYAKGITYPSNISGIFKDFKHLIPAEDMPTLIHAFVFLRLDYCNFLYFRLHEKEPHLLHNASGTKCSSQVIHPPTLPLPRHPNSSLPTMTFNQMEHVIYNQPT